MGGRRCGVGSGLECAARAFGSRRGPSRRTVFRRPRPWAQGAVGWLQSPRSGWFFSSTLQPRSCGGWSFQEGRRALSWALKLRRQPNLSQPLCRPPPSPPARRPGPRAPALRLAAADWLVGVTCKGRGRGCAAATAPLLGARLQGCSKNSPGRQSPAAGISTEKAEVLPPQRGASPTALT